LSNISEEHAASIFRVKEMKDPKMAKYNLPPKLHSVSSKDTASHPGRQ
jgi:hypothetical protein